MINIIITSRYLSEALKKKIAAKQNFRCANNPNVNIEGMDDYKCLLWRLDDLRGSFDASGYEIDHIEEFCINKNNEEKNLQALCHSCHAYKTRNFQMNKSNIISKKRSEYNSIKDSKDFRKNLSENSEENSSEDSEENYVENSNEDSEESSRENSEENPKKITKRRSRMSDIKRGFGYICKRCNKKFYNKSHFNDHMNRKFPCTANKKKSKISNDNNTYCEKCDKYFSRPYALKRHMETHHNDNSHNNLILKPKNLYITNMQLN